VAAFCALGPSALLGRAARQTACNLFERICLLALMYQPMARACIACFNASQQHGTKQEVACSSAVLGMRITPHLPMDKRTADARKNNRSGTQVSKT
jgi:hypothetical protein